MSKIFEGIEFGDLKRLVEPILTIDTYRSKMGDDSDICVLSFTVFGKDPAVDLETFVEKSYDWVLDADASSGETSDGNYLVFVEIARDSKLPEHIYGLVSDMLNLTGQKIEDWRFKYHQKSTTHRLTIDLLRDIVIASPKEYKHTVSSDIEESISLDELRLAAGIQIKPKQFADPRLQAIQTLAGIK